jgi:hypothetical protein
MGEDYYPMPWASLKYDTIGCSRPPNYKECMTHRKIAPAVVALDHGLGGFLLVCLQKPYQPDQTVDVIRTLTRQV